jgi:hypothetical protein
MLLGLVCWLCAACGVDPNAPTSATSATSATISTTNRSALIGGQAEPDDTYLAVGELVSTPSNSDGGSAAPIICTGTLIGGGVVLTAAHCLFLSDGTPLADAGWQTRFLMGSDVKQGPLANSVPVRTWVPNPSINLSNLSEGDDIGLVMLARDVTGDGATFVPMPYAQSDDSSLDPNPSCPGTCNNPSLLFLGYGVSSVNANDDGLQRSEIMAVADANDPDGPCFDPNFDFLHQFCFGSAGHDICAGDFGGPAIQLIGGVQTVVGVSSFSDATCSQYGVDMRVDAYNGWIAEVLASQGGPLENCGNGIDDDGDNLIDCDDPDCAGSPRCQPTSSSTTGTNGVSTSSTTGGSTSAAGTSTTSTTSTSTGTGGGTTGRATSTTGSSKASATSGTNSSSGQSINDGGCSSSGSSDLVGASSWLLWLLCLRFDVLARTRRVSVFVHVGRRGNAGE